MAVTTNTTTTTDLNSALDQEMVMNFTGESDRLLEILGLLGSVETMTAGQALQQVTITGTLNNAKTDASTLPGESGSVTLGSSSGTAYVEGDEVALSKYTVAKTPVGVVEVEPYRKLTTAQAILKSGYEVAVLRTDRKMLAQVRSQIISNFFTFLATGTGTSTAGASLQAMLANMDASLGDTLETNSDESERIIHFINRQDAAEYLGAKEVTTQTAFGMTYMQDFLGIQNVFVTNKVTKGTAWATPVENIHAFGLDFSSLATAGLTYTQEANGLIGVAHTPAYDRVSAETHVINGMLLFPEVKNYMVKGTITPTA